MSTTYSKICEMTEQVHVQREEILKAFLARYELFPEECEQVTQHNIDGSLSWFIRKKEGT
jgi:hypothetical protein